MRAGRTVAAAALVVALVVLTPMSASALEPSTSVSTADTVPNFDPSANKWRRWMVNLLSSVMGAATPSKYRAEQIANAYYYDHGFETLNAQFGIDGVRTDANGKLTGVRWVDKGSGTYTDVVISQLEEKYKSPSAKGTGAVRAPATPIKTAIKVVGGATSVYLAHEVGAFLGGQGANLLGSWLGFDANGQVCSAEGFDSEIQRWVFQSMAGQNCDGFEDFKAEYQVNLDASGGFSLTYNGQTLLYVRTTVFFRDFPEQTGAGVYRPYGYCYSGGTLVGGYWPGFASGYTVQIRKAWGDKGWLDLPMGTNDNAGTQYGCDVGQVFFGGGAYDNEIRLRNNATGTFITGAPVVEDLLRQNQCDVTMTDGSHLLGPLTAPYKESEGSAPTPLCPDIPAGKTPDKVEMVQQNPGTTPDQVLQSSPVTPEYKDWWQQYPECRNGACALDLIRLSPSPAVSCFDLEAGCVDWFDDPSKSSHYQCRYGVHNVDLEECNVYAGIFQPGRTTTGAPYSDPSTGEWSGGQNAPKSGDQAMNAALQDPELTRSCNFPDFALDPVSWVLTPVNCALERNFVPRPTVVEVALAGAGESWEGKAPVVLAEAAESLAINPSVSGCSRSATLFGVTFDVLNTCSGPMATIALWSRWITSAGMVVLVLVVLRRQVAAMVGYNQGQG